MKTSIATLMLSSCAALAAPTMAQEPGAGAPKPAMSASMPMDCPMMAKDGQGGTGASQDMPMGKEMKCAMPVKGTTGKPAKSKPGHDHGKFHKNQ
jgi:hypothetical protein